MTDCRVYHKVNVFFDANLFSVLQSCSYARCVNELYSFKNTTGIVHNVYCWEAIYDRKSYLGAHIVRCRRFLKPPTPNRRTMENGRTADQKEKVFCGFSIYRQKS